MIIQSKNVWLSEELKPAQIQIEHGKLTGIYPYNKEAVDVDYGDLWILPDLLIFIPMAGTRQIPIVLIWI